MFRDLVTHLESASPAIGFDLPCGRQRERPVHAIGLAVLALAGRTNRSRGIIAADEAAFADWWLSLSDLAPRLANECIWLATENGVWAD